MLQNSQQQWRRQLGPRACKPRRKAAVLTGANWQSLPKDHKCLEISLRTSAVRADLTPWCRANIDVYKEIL